MHSPHSSNFQPQQKTNYKLSLQLTLPLFLKIRLQEKKFALYLRVSLKGRPFPNIPLECQLFIFLEQSRERFPYASRNRGLPREGMQ